MHEARPTGRTWTWHYTISRPSVSVLHRAGRDRLDDRGDGARQTTHRRDMAPLTAAPFVRTAWLLLFALYQFGQLRPTEPIHPMLVHPGATIQTGLQAPAGDGAVVLTAADLANALFRGIAEVFLQDSLWTDVVFAIAILVNSRTCVVFALFGSALRGMTALMLGADRAAIYHGLYGFNAVLTGIALGGLFRVLEWQSTIYAFIGAIFSAIVFAVIAVALSPIGTPALTAPFVLTTWVFLLPDGRLQSTGSGI